MDDRKRFLFVLAGFAASACALLFLAGLAFEHGLPWREAQDPRKRLLWDARGNESRIVLLGDSEFASFCVDTPDRTLGSRLAALTGQGVFPGALDGAKRADILSAARYVAAKWPKGSVVLVDLVPSRFLFEERDGNYRTSFEHLVSLPPVTFEDRVKRTLVFPVTSRLFLFRNSQAVESYLVHTLRRALGRPEEPFFRNELSRNRVWDRDGNFALDRYRVFEENFGKRTAVPLDFLQELERIGQEHGLRVVFVLTPLNVTLVERYARHVPAGQVIEEFDDQHAKVRRFLDGIAAPYIDLYATVPSDGFADLVHTNEKGDAILAEKIARWLADHP